jgi:hypothetical protein
MAATNFNYMKQLSLVPMSLTSQKCLFSLQHIDALINYSVCRIGKFLYMAGGTGYNANNEAFHSDRAFVYDVVKDR